MANLQAEGSANVKLEKTSDRMDGGSKARYMDERRWRERVRNGVRMPFDDEDRDARVRWREVGMR